MTTSPTIDRPSHDSPERPRQAADLSGNQLAGAARRIGRVPVPADRAALAVLLLGTAVLYLWGLGESGWANSFYSGAAQAGSESWKALFFGASDAAGSITVDKTPLALWPMALSVKVFGLSSWSILVPQALEGVAAVSLLHHTVRRTTGSAAAGLLAGAVLALTPVAVLMFRFNNPDALLVLLLVGSAYATQRAVEATSIEAGRPKTWLALGGALVGLAFLAKMLQAFLVLPALALVYLLFAALPWRTRIGHLLVAFGAMVLAGGWWVAIVSLWPAGDRPYIGGSQDNSILELTLGYNGLGRLTGEETGSVGGQMGWGETGLLRMFNSEVGSQVAWLIPAAMILGAGALWFARRDRQVLTGLILWLGWGLVTGLTFSLMAGIFHPYYTVALAPAIAACIGICAHVLWRHRHHLVASALLAAATAFTATWTYSLLGRIDWQPWLRYAVLVLGLAAALALFGLRHLPRRVGVAVAAAALISALAGPTAYSLATAASPHTGSIPSAGPSASATGFRGGPMGGMGTPNAGANTNGASTGGLLDGSTSSDALNALLSEDASSYTWVAAAVGSNSASGYQLATELPVMAIGGFNGSDPSPTLAEFQEYVANGEIHWFIASGGGMGGGFGGPNAGGSTSSEIATWVQENFTAQTVDGVTVYDLSQGA
jgi:4-amino-4-deoxy-L-arabinose transferase-like glycosyltransferase